MRAISSAASITIHAAVAATLLLGTTKQGRSESRGIDTIDLIVPQPPSRMAGPGGGVAGPIPIPRVDWSANPGTIPVPAPALQPGELTPTFSTDWAPSSAVGGAGAGRSGGAGVAEFAPEVLSGPLPAYPDLLRQAGVEGQVVLEARVDSTGRVQKGSVSVVFATHPGFVEPARAALLATLFRPARVNGRAVAMLVRLPFAFAIRGGTGRAR